MQVKKFEAKTIKEAIELVKYHLGPDAIILSAKDNQKSFGLVGESSVEVTAAVSDTKLAQKRMAESKLNKLNKTQYQSSSARTQKKFIDKVFEQRTNDDSAKRQMARNEFISENQDAGFQNEAAQLPKIKVPHRPTTERYADIDSSTSAQATTHASAQYSTVKANDPAHVSELQKEVQRLKSMLANFQSIPQSFQLPTQNNPQNYVSLHPGAADGLPYELSFSYKKLLDAGLSAENIVAILRIANEVLPIEQKHKKAFVDGWIIKYLLENVQIVAKPLKSKFQVFVGPTGQGKTSTVIKMACHLIMKEKKKIAILSGDNIKIGAGDQLKIYSQILNVPCAPLKTTQDWLTLEKSLEKFDYVLVDTAGVTLKSPEDYEILRNVLPLNKRDVDVHYVQSAVARDVDAFEVAQRFKSIGFDDVIFTRLDEAVQHGIIYNFQKTFEVPLHSFGIGSALPEDYEFATKERVIDLIFNLSNLKRERGQI